MNTFSGRLMGLVLKNRVLVLIAGVVLFGIGVYSYLHTPIDAFPDLTNTRIQVITQWNGRSAEEVERFVSIPIELALTSCPKKVDVRSTSLFGLSVVSVTFEDEVEDFEARQYASSRLQNVSLPNGAQAEMEPPYGPTGEIFRYVLVSKKYNDRELKTLQDWVVERQLRLVSGIADVNAFGGLVKTYEVSVIPPLLAKYGITSIDVFNALQNSNINVGGDVIVRHNQAYVVRGIGLLRGVADIENVIITNINGVPLHVKNIGTVQESSAPPLGYVGVDSSTTGMVETILVMRKGEDPAVVLKGIKDKIAELNETILPAGVKIVPTYDRTDLTDRTIHTVRHNVLMGVALVTLIVFLFIGDWRATVISALIIPFALMFAFMCLRLKGMTANLLSMGAIDFGIIVDGTVVMVEGLFIILDRRAVRVGMDRYNNASKWGLIRTGAVRLSRPIFFAKIIIITALLPIFTFQRIEGKMFSPLAWTLGFALLGALLATLTIVPVMMGLLFNKNAREKHTLTIRIVHASLEKSLTWCRNHKTISYSVGLLVFVFSMFFATRLGTEFLPHLNEGTLWIRASLPYSSSLDYGADLSRRIRFAIKGFPEVKTVTSQTGRPNDGTDATGFFNQEFLVELKPESEWPKKKTREELINELNTKFNEFPGIDFSFSQYIMDNVEEWVSGVKGSLSVKIYGYDADKLEAFADTVYNQLGTVKGVEDLAIVHLKGQPDLRVELDLPKMAAYGVNTADAQNVLSMAIGGSAATQIYEEEKAFDLRVRYAPEYRRSDEEIGNLMIPAASGTPVPLKLISKIYSKTGMEFLYRENGKRFIAVKFSVRERDLGSTISEAQGKVSKVLKLDKGMRISWEGEYQNQVRATERLKTVVPISLVLILAFLYLAFGNIRDALLIFLNVPFSVMGGILALGITGTNFGISAGIGFIALFGVAVQSGVILISIFHEFMEEKMPIHQAIFQGTLLRVRPVFMTALMAVFGLLPAALSTGPGSETAKPLAIVVIGGLITDCILSLHLFPLIVEFVYRRISKLK